MRSEPSPIRSRTRGQRTATGPMPVMISRSGKCPWRTSRWRPSSVSLSAWPLSKAATSASTACASSARAPLRKTSVSGSAKVPGWESWKTLVSVTAYHSFGGEVEASNTPTIRRLIPSRRHQLSPIAPTVACFMAGTVNAADEDSELDSAPQSALPVKLGAWIEATKLSEYVQITDLRRTNTRARFTFFITKPLVADTKNNASLITDGRIKDDTTLHT